MAIKSRRSIAFSGNGQSRKSGFHAWKPYSLTFLNSERITDSGGHRGWRNLGESPGDVGGSAIIEKTVFFPSPAHVNEWNMVGPWCPTHSSGVPNLTIPSTISLEASGATGIARTTPTTPSFSIATSVAELVREGIPSYVGSTLFKDKVRLAKSAGDEYLNLEFGWKPIVRDLRSFAHTVKNHNRVIADYVKGSDRKIKRRYVIGDTSTSGGTEGRLVAGTPVLNGVANSFWTKQDLVQFSGAFRYHVPLGTTTAGKLAEFESKANALLGTRLTPEVVWNLTPWSWAVDWLSNVGDVMHNISTLGRDGLVLQYGYVTSKSEVRNTVQSTLTASKVYNASCTTVSKYYVRLGSSPFGFGMTAAGFSNQQKAIVAALGLSKGGKWVT